MILLIVNWILPRFGSNDLVILIYLNNRMIVEEPSDRIKTQNLNDDLEVKTIDCINVLKTIIWLIYY